MASVLRTILIASAVMATATAQGSECRDIGISFTDRLIPGQCLRNGGYRLEMQYDGNLVLYNGDGTVPVGRVEPTAPTVPTQSTLATGSLTRRGYRWNPPSVSCGNTSVNTQRATRAAMSASIAKARSGSPMEKPLVASLSVQQLVRSIACLPQRCGKARERTSLWTPDSDYCMMKSVETWGRINKWLK